MAAMAGKLIDKNYLKMKKALKDSVIKREGHLYWEWKPLSENNLTYAILDGYVTYELYRRITLVNQGQLHLVNLAMCPCCLIRHAVKAESSSESSRKKRKSGWGWDA